MADQYVAEIRIFPFNFAPIGWAMCNGQILAISTYTAVFSLLGINYGGNGTSNFALPNLQNASPLHFGNGAGGTYSVGESGGEQSVTLTYVQMPAHTHAPAAAIPGTYSDPNGTIFGEPATQRPTPNFYASSLASPVNMNSLSIGFTGGSQPHNNMMPYLTLNYCIALTGIFPPRS